MANRVAAAAPRNLNLDILRALAIVLVFGRHIDPAPADWGWLSSLTLVWQRGGWIGVDVFFVLSGFLVSGLLFREHIATGRIDAVRFLIRRGFKIYPGFYVLAISTAIAVGTLNRPIIAELLFLQNYLGGAWGHTWSLAVEEHFYLLLAASAWLTSRAQVRTWRYVPLAYVVVAAGCLAGRLVVAGQPFDGLTHFAPTHLRIDGLMFGVALSYWWHYTEMSRVLLRYRWGLCVLGVALLAPAFVVELGEAPWMAHIGFTMLSFGAGALLVGSLLIDLRPTRVARWLAMIGACSYSIYLWHLLLGHAAHTWLLSFGWAAYALTYLGSSLVVGIALSRAMEAPALAIRDRLFPSASGHLVVPSVPQDGDQVAAAGCASPALVALKDS